MTSNSIEPSHSEPSLNGTAAGKPTRSIVESLQWIIRVGFEKLKTWDCLLQDTVLPSGVARVGQEEAKHEVGSCKSRDELL